MTTHRLKVVKKTAQKFKGTINWHPFSWYEVDVQVY